MFVFSMQYIKILYTVQMALCVLGSTYHTTVNATISTPTVINPLTTGSIVVVVGFSSNNCVNLIRYLNTNSDINTWNIVPSGNGTGFNTIITGGQVGIFGANVFYANGYFVANIHYGSLNNTVYSTDGKNWTGMGILATNSNYTSTTWYDTTTSKWYIMGGSSFNTATAGFWSCPLTPPTSGNWTCISTTTNLSTIVGSGQITFSFIGKNNYVIAGTWNTSTMFYAPSPYTSWTAVAISGAFWTVDYSSSLDKWVRATSTGISYASGTALGTWTTCTIANFSSTYMYSGFGEMLVSGKFVTFSPSRGEFLIALVNVTTSSPLKVDILKSTDGITFTKVASVNSYFASASAAGATGTYMPMILKWVESANKYIFIQGVNATNSTRYYYSSDGVSWTTVSTTLPSYNVAYYPFGVAAF